jgi:DNA uptake protein ComE-like DNA-binding protein
MNVLRMLPVVALVVLASAPAALAQAAASPVLNPNTATEKEMLALPHMTPAVAKRVIAARPFKTILALNSTLSPALSEAQRKELYVRLFVPINLNTASREEIMLVPGMGNRMAHEFEEYRPYKNIAQFRKEIGKYVDDAEVARFEKYVTLN